MKKIATTNHFFSVCGLLVGCTAIASGATRGLQWHPIELSFEADKSIVDPLREVDFFVELESPSGQKQTVRGYWDGGRQWKCRFQGTQPGTWQYQTIARGKGSLDSALGHQQGEVTILPYSGENPLYRHGRLRVAADQRHFEHSDGKPFFWIGDTCWTGPLKASLEDWQSYLRIRHAQGFNLIQLMMTQSLAAAGNAEGRMAFVGQDRITIDPEFFQWLDLRLDLINQEGMVFAGAMIWSAVWNKPAQYLNPGCVLPESEIILLGRYMMARYGAHHAVWFLAGDDDYTGERAKRWQRVGSAVFDLSSHALVSMHPSSLRWVGDEFDGEGWFGFHGYQSGHWPDADSARWIQQGPPALDWRTGRPRPTINLEPCYEDHVRLREGTRWTADGVRRRMMWSLLVSPTAGVSYGGHGVWSWETSPALPLNHEHALIAKPWNEAINLPAARQMIHLRAFFESLAWWTLRPRHDLPLSQPEKAEAFIAAASSKEAGLVGYTAMGQSILLPDKSDWSTTGQWTNPRTGDRETALPGEEEGRRRYSPPSSGDWLLHLPPH